MSAFTSRFVASRMASRDRGTRTRIRQCETRAASIIASHDAPASALRTAGLKRSDTVAAGRAALWRGLRRTVAQTRAEHDDQCRDAEGCRSGGNGFLVKCAEIPYRDRTCNDKHGCRECNSTRQAANRPLAPSGWRSRRGQGRPQLRASEPRTQSRECPSYSEYQKRRDRCSLILVPHQQASQ